MSQEKMKIQPPIQPLSSREIQEKEQPISLFNHEDMGSGGEDKIIIEDAADEDCTPQVREKFKFHSSA